MKTMKNISKTLIKAVRSAANPENTVSQYIMAIGAILCALSCLSVLLIAAIPAAVVYIVITVSMLFIAYAVFYIANSVIQSKQRKIEYHQEEVELLKNIFVEIKKHSLYENVKVEFNKDNKKIIRNILLDFIGEHKSYNTDYYNNLIYSCQHAICMLDDLM
jgi:hypothetical protein